MSKGRTDVRLRERGRASAYPVFGGAMMRRFPMMTTSRPENFFSSSRTSLCCTLWNAGSRRNGTCTWQLRHPYPLAGCFPYPLRTDADSASSPTTAMAVTVTLPPCVRVPLTDARRCEWPGNAELTGAAGYVNTSTPTIHLLM